MPTHADAAIPVSGLETMHTTFAQALSGEGKGMKKIGRHEMLSNDYCRRVRG